MLDEVILHIGTHKTGSTSIQRVLEAETALLREHDVVYPKSFTDPAGHPEVAWSLRKGYENHLKGKNAQSIADDYQRQADKEKCGRLVLSTEEFWTLPRPMIVKLKSLFPAKKYKVLIFYRRQDAYLEFAFNQHVRMYQLRSHEPMFEFFVKFGISNQLNYASIISQWDQVLGKGAAEVSVYEACHNIPGGVLGRIINLMNIELDARTENCLYGGSRHNKGLSVAAVLAMASINRHNDLNEKQHRSVLAKLAEIDADTPSRKHRLLSLSERKVFVDKYMPMNIRLIEQFGKVDELQHWAWASEKENEYSYPSKEEIESYFDGLRASFPKITLQALS